jgi:hypothetical protein
VADERRASGQSRGAAALALVKCCRPPTRTIGLGRQAGLRCEDQPCAVGSNSSLPLAGTTIPPPPLRDLILRLRPRPRHQHPPSSSHAHLRDPLTRPSHCSRIVTTTVLARPATILGPHAFTPTSPSHQRARSPRLETINRFKNIEQNSFSRSIESFNRPGRLFGA